LAFHHEHEINHHRIGAFRGRVEDGISIGRAESVEKVASKYLKHLGQESIYELF